MKTRDDLIEAFLWEIGGFDGGLFGHLSDTEIKDDKKVVEFLLDTHEADVTEPLKKEIIELKAKLYDKG